MDPPDGTERAKKAGVRVRSAARQDTIVFANPTNRDLGDPGAETWEEVEALVLERLETWRKDPTHANTCRVISPCRHAGCP